MESISSARMVWFKRVLPVCWAVGTVALAATMLLSPTSSADAHPVAFFAPLVVFILAGVLMYGKFTGRLADEVQDGGAWLLVRRGAIEQRVPLSDVVDVSVNHYANPCRITLRVRTPGPLGHDIVFLPKAPLSFNPFARNAVADDLVKRVAHARTLEMPGK